MTNEMEPQISSLVAGRIGLGAFWQSSILPPFSSLSMHSLPSLVGLVWATATPWNTTSPDSVRSRPASSRRMRTSDPPNRLTGDDEGEDEPEQGERLGEGD